MADACVLERLRDGDVAAFDALVRRHHPGLVRVAGIYVESESAAEEVARETWLAVIAAHARAAPSAPARVWIFGLCLDRAMARAGPERRPAPPPRGDVAAAVAALPRQERVTLVLRDVERWSAGDVCALLRQDSAEHRAVLHRARETVRALLYD